MFVITLACDEVFDKHVILVSITAFVIPLVSFFAIEIRLSPDEAY